MTVKNGRMRRRRNGFVLVAAGCAVAASGCQPSLHAATRRPDPPQSAAPTPRPTITVLKGARTLAAGGTAPFEAQRGVSLRLTASRPKVSRVRLSSSYGYAPAHGYYVTFTLTLVNTGTQPVQVGPSNFVARIPGEGKVTSYDGNAPYSGASAQLDTTVVDPQQTVRAPVTFDVRRPHGTLSFVPDRSAAIVWRF
jgi:hypothetical protein